MKQDSISWSELAQLTHATQVEQFNWCACEDLDDRKEAPYPDCPVQAIDQVKDQVAEENGVGN